jgi:hypothetical protein
MFRVTENRTFEIIDDGEIVGIVWPDDNSWTWKLHDNGRKGYESTLERALFMAQLCYDGSEKIPTEVELLRQIADDTRAILNELRSFIVRLPDAEPHSNLSESHL